MLRLTVAVLASLALALPSTAAEAKKLPDLRVKDVAAKLTGRQVALSATVRNKGSKKAAASVTTFRLSKDAAVGADDLVLATVATPRLRPKAKSKVAGTAALPATVPAGTYRVLACADGAAKVEEKRESDNCAASQPVVLAPSTTTPPSSGQVTIRWRTVALAGVLPYGPVTATATAGTCTATGATGSCTVPAGAATVTLTAGGLLPPVITFSGWFGDLGASCAGTSSGPVRTIVDPVFDQSCVGGYAVLML